MGDNFQESSMVREIQYLLRKLGFDEIQTRLIIDKLRAELIEQLDKTTEEQILLKISEHLNKIITKVDAKVDKNSYNHYYRKLVDYMVGGAIYDFIKLVIGEITADPDLRALFTRRRRRDRPSAMARPFRFTLHRREYRRHRCA
jgi:hypothetical protein